MGAIPERPHRLGEELAPRRVGGVPRAVTRLSLGATRLRPLGSAVGGQPVRLGEVADLARLQVRLGARECALRMGAAELVGRQPALAGALVDDPPAEELGRDRHLVVGVAAGVERRPQTGWADQLVAIGLIGRNAPVTKGCGSPRLRHTMNLTEYELNTVIAPHSSTWKVDVNEGGERASRARFAPGATVAGRRGTAGSSRPPGDGGELSERRSSPIFGRWRDAAAGRVVRSSDSEGQRGKTPE